MIEKAILPIKINELVSIISEKKRIGRNDAMSYLYSSDFYKQLLDPDNKWWYLSGLNLYRELEKEKKRQIQREKSIRSEKLFMVFCTENYRLSKQLDAKQVHALFQELRVYEFLIQNYEVLHSQGESYILEQIDIYIKKHTQR